MFYRMSYQLIIFEQIRDTRHIQQNLHLIKTRYFLLNVVIVVESKFHKTSKNEWQCSQLKQYNL